MRKHLTKSLLSVASLLLVAGSLWAHHGQGNSFATNHMWTTWATVEEFGYINPHPVIKFTRTDKNGKVEHWVAEVNDAPAILARSGWTKCRSMEALKPGTRVKLYLATSLAGGFIGLRGVDGEREGRDHLQRDESNPNRPSIWTAFPVAINPSPEMTKKE